MAIQQETLIQAIEEAKRELLRKKDELDKFSFPEATKFQFETSSINVDDLVREIPIGSSEEDYIYIFKVVGQNRTNRSFYKNLKDKKSSQTEEKKKDLPRINEENIGTQYLYVGRSQKLRSRLRQHLGRNYEGTYALHMERWVSTLNETIEVQYFKLEDCDNLLVQSVEDSLWSKLRPAFGRKGDK